MADIMPPRPGEDHAAWRERFDAETAHLDGIEKKERLRHLLDRARRRPNIPTRIRREVFQRDGHACVACGATERLSLDHIYPYSRGGSDLPTNLQTLCMPCNVRKGDA